MQMLGSHKQGARSKGRGRLPVPTLRHTLDRYLDSLEPFLHEDESRGGMSFGAAYSLRQKWANDFEASIGSTLQERLLGMPFLKFVLTSRLIVLISYSA